MAHFFPRYPPQLPPPQGLPLRRFPLDLTERKLDLGLYSVIGHSIILSAIGDGSFWPKGAGLPGMASAPFFFLRVPENSAPLAYTV